MHVGVVGACVEPECFNLGNGELAYFDLGNGDVEEFSVKYNPRLGNEENRKFKGR